MASLAFTTPGQISSHLRSSALASAGKVPVNAPPSVPEEIKGAFLTFQKDADQIYPGWKESLGYTGESSVQAASFDWKKKNFCRWLCWCASFLL